MSARAEGHLVRENNLFLANIRVRLSDILISQYLTNHVTDEVLEMRPFRFLAEGAHNVNLMEQIVTRLSSTRVWSLEGGQVTLDVVHHESPP